MIKVKGMFKTGTWSVAWQRIHSFKKSRDKNMNSLNYIGFKKVSP